MSTYLIVDITVHNPEMFKEYARKAQPFVEKHSGVYLVRGGEVQILEGTWSPQRLVVVEFPDKESAKEFWPIRGISLLQQSGMRLPIQTWLL